MRYVTILNTDLKPAILCLGTAEMGSKINRTTAFQILDAYVDRGGNYLDTAKVYADWLPGERSASEKLLGEWMAARGNRNKIILMTKGGHPDVQTMHTPRLSPDEILHDLHASLQHLRTDVIDLYVLHRDDPNRSVEEILTVLNDQVKAGKIRYFGCFSWQPARLKVAQAFAANNGFQGFVANQVLWNAAVVDSQGIPDKSLVAMDQDMWQYHRDTGLAAVPFSPLVSGTFHHMEQQSYLSRMLNASLKSGRNRFRSRHSMYPPLVNQQQFQHIKRIAQESNLSLTQVLLGYLLSQPFPTFPIVSCRTLKRLEESLSATEIQLSILQSAIANPKSKIALPGNRFAIAKETTTNHTLW